MKKGLVLVCLLFVMLGLTSVSISGAEKKSYKTDIEKMLKGLKDFEFSLLYEIDVKEPEIGTTKGIKLDKDRMSRIAAFTLDYSYKDSLYKNSDENSYENDYEYKYEYNYEDKLDYICQVNDSALKKAGKNLFGKTLKASYITSDERCIYRDVYKDDEYGVVYKYKESDGEEKGEFCVYSTSVKKKGKKYTATKKCYLGFAYGQITRESNYTITYTLKKSSKSEYGYIITGLKVKKTGKTLTREDILSLLYEDADGDMISTFEEMYFGTDPLKADTDGDGIDDYFEIVNGRDPVDPKDKDDFNSYHDIDIDGLTDFDEIRIYKTDPLNDDTDDDGLSDGFEIVNKFDPLNTDTDGDGVPDGEEKFEQTYVFDTSDLGWAYDELLKSAGQKKTYFGDDEITVREDIGLIKRIIIKANMAGDISDRIDIENMYGRHVILTRSDFIAGIPVEITFSKDVKESTFKNAELIFEYDDEWLADGEEDVLIPVFSNDNSGIWYAPIEDYTIDKVNNTISFMMDRPGYYNLINLDKYSKIFSRY